MELILIASLETVDCTIFGMKLVLSEYVKGIYIYLYQYSLSGDISETEEERKDIDEYLNRPTIKWMKLF